MTPVDAIWLFFSEDVAVARHFVAARPPSLPPPTHPAGMLVVLTTPVKNLSKMAGYSASYSFNSWCIGRVSIAIESWRISCKHLFSFSRYNTSNN